LRKSRYEFFIFMVKKSFSILTWLFCMAVKVPNQAAKRNRERFPDDLMAGSIRALDFHLRKGHAGRVRSPA
jgi:hypothetical protein